MKKERSGGGSVSSSSSRMKKLNSDSENEVAEILNELKTRMNFLHPPLWGFKKKRSAIAVYSSPPSKPKAASPLTPLSFPFSDHESDDIPTPPSTKKKNKESSVKKDREELIKDNNSLHEEVKNVESFRDRVKNYNLKLKERQQKLSVGPPNQTAEVSTSGSGLVSYDVGPTGIPDLNIPLEEEPVECRDEGLDVNVVMANNRAMAAQARKNRRHICRIKNPIPTNKNHRYSFST